MDTAVDEPVAADTHRARKHRDGTRRGDGIRRANRVDVMRDTGGERDAAFDSGAIGLAELC